MKKIRVWKLGSLEHKIFPTEEAAKKLADILENATGETLDIIWGPDIEVIELDGDEQTKNSVVVEKLDSFEQEKK